SNEKIKFRKKELFREQRDLPLWSLWWLLRSFLSSLRSLLETSRDSQVIFLLQISHIRSLSPSVKHRSTESAQRELPITLRPVSITSRLAMEFISARQMTLP